MTVKNPRQPRRPKHIPQRTCMVCREKNDKRRLTRIVNNQEEGILIDPTGKKTGRGAYVCQKDSCWETISRSNALELALKTPVSAEQKAALVAQYKQKEVVSHA